jgi:EAL domain-containing protein (putative c-di-GMP-specific phosphodiesterase class I)/GGDEF domain-containing protein
MEVVRQSQTDVGRDALTGLVGRDAARARLETWLAEGGQVHALLLSLTRLDTINLAYGSVAGDGALAEVAARIQHFAGDEFDSPWFAARLGGTSFLIAARAPCTRERWGLFAEGLCEQVARPVGDLRLSPRMALLSALPEEDADGVLGRLAQAQAALGRRSARRLSWVDGGAARPARSAARLEADLHKAIERDEIEVLFQPQFALPLIGGAGDALTGAEALARWQHPQLGRIGAGALFSIAERIDFMPQLSQHIAAKALALASSWPDHLRLSINVTAADLAGENYAKVLGGIVAGSDFPADRLTMEVTEQALLSDIELARRSLEELAAQGMKVALDDFGAGFCNFRYLKLLPLDYLKLDRSMVDGVAEDARDLAVLRGIVAMARALGLGVIAEGIETEAQRAAVEAEGCGCWQGFLRAEPMGAETFLDFAKT